MDYRDPRARMLLFLRQLGEDVATARPGPYRDGYVAALEELDEFILDELWEEGDEPPEEVS
jgi:hypothetical protein